MKDTATCSLCGGDTEIEIDDGSQAEWYLCTGCEGTPEAERAGYSHTQKPETFVEGYARIRQR